MRYTVDPNGKLPIYRQLADAILSDIESGKLPHGSRLPTVRELSEELSLARGTVKRAYEALQAAGAVEMTQGRGTFVSYQPAQAQGRKEIAMEAIDEMFHRLDALSFSPAEIAIYLNLKQRQYAMEESGVQLAVIVRGAEILSQLSRQLQSLRGVEVHPLLLSDTEEFAGLEESVDLIVAPDSDGQEAARLLNDTEKLLRVVLAPDRETVVSLARLAPGKRIGIVSGSERFAAMAAETCRAYARASVAGTFLLGVGDLEAFLAGCDYALLPPDYEKLCSAEEERLLRAAERKQRVIRCAYQIDGGSMLCLEQRLREAQRTK
ncbi:MAG: GntR family transcriptional regulator [Oscillospiraceae bacterium]|nr:GntR family transcriptional regulator [Oscillospiraceae bacterium]